MSLYRYPGSKVWTMDFMFHSQRIRESTGTRSKTLAKKVEAKRRQRLEEGAGVIRKQQAPRILFVAGEEWLEMKRPGWSPGMFTIAKTALGHLGEVLGKRYYLAGRIAEKSFGSRGCVKDQNPRRLIARTAK